jgi:hypothetical protein
VAIFALEKWYDEGRICTFYTVRWENEESSETDKFFDKYAVPEHHLEKEALELLRLITENIGNKYGATNDFFDRVENLAQALPPRPKNRIEEIKALGSSFPLRLFCFHVTNNLVILFNGGIKNAPTSQESDLFPQFREAQEFAQKIEDALLSEMIEISDDGRSLQNFDNTTEIFL